MVGDENVEWADFGKEAHFIDGHHDSIDNFVFERFQDYCAIFDSEFDSSGIRAILYDTFTDSFVAQDSDNVAVSTGAMAFNLGQKGFLKEPRKGWSKVLWRQRNCVLQFLLQS